MDPVVLDAIGRHLNFRDWSSLLSAEYREHFVPSFRLELLNYVLGLIERQERFKVFVGGGSVEYIAGNTSEFNDIDLYLGLLDLNTSEFISELNGYFGPLDLIYSSQEQRAKLKQQEAETLRGQQMEESDESSHNSSSSSGSDSSSDGMSDSDLDAERVDNYPNDVFVLQTHVYFGEKHRVQIIVKNIGLHIRTNYVFARESVEAYDVPIFCGSCLFIDEHKNLCYGVVVNAPIPILETGTQCKRLDKYLKRYSCESIPVRRLPPISKFMEDFRIDNFYHWRIVY